MTAPNSRPRILIVDDDLDVLEVVTTILEEAFEVVPISKGPEAVNLLQNGANFDLLFTDILMPDMNGLEVARKAKELRPTLRVLYGTGFMESLGLRSVKLEGPVISKPYRADELKREIEKVLAG